MCKHPSHVNEEVPWVVLELSLNARVMLLVVIPEAEGVDSAQDFCGGCLVLRLLARTGVFFGGGLGLRRLAGPMPLWSMPGVSCTARNPVRRGRVIGFFTVRFFTAAARKKKECQNRGIGFTQRTNNRLKAYLSFGVAPSGY